MSKKTIAFEMPKAVAARTRGAHRTDPMPQATSAEEWMNPRQMPADATASRIAITISTTPNWFEVAKIGFFLPYLVCWAWTLEATQRNLRLFAR
jgi:hypothetical protein